MSKLTFLSKVHVGRGNYKYTYLCECEAEKSKIISVTTGNDSSAEMLAQLECDEYCEEPLTQRHPEYSADLRSLLNIARPTSKFIVWVNEVDEAALHIELCTGGKVILPRNVIENFKLIGTTESNDKVTKFGLVSINISTAEGLAIYQLSEIIKNFHSNNTKQDFSHLLKEESQSVSVSCSGTACKEPAYSYLTSQYPITDFAFNRAEGCNVVAVIRLGSKQLRIQHTAYGGTPCGNSYSGTAWIDIVIDKPDTP